MKFTLDTNIWQGIAEPERYEDINGKYDVALFKELQKQIFLHPENDYYISSL